MWPPPVYSTSGAFEAHKISYNVRSTVHRGREADVVTYTCLNITIDTQRFFGAIDIPVQDYTQSSNGYTIKMEAALEYNGMMSDYVTVMMSDYVTVVDRSRGICNVPIVISKCMKGSLALLCNKFAW